MAYRLLGNWIALLKKFLHKGDSIKSKLSPKYLYAFGIILAAASLSTYLATKLLVEAAVDQETPKVMQKAGSLIFRTQHENAFLSELDAASKQKESEHN